MRRGRLAKLRAGVLLPWTRAPYGYRLHPDRPRDPTGVTLDPAEAALVAEIFARYLEPGVSLMRVARALRERQIRSPTGKPVWGLATLRGILRNPAYTGQVYAGRMRFHPPRIRRSATHPIGRPHDSGANVPPEEWIPVATIPAVVTQAQFDLVQNKLSKNQSFATRHNTAHPYLLRALVSCGHCLHNVIPLPEYERRRRELEQRDQSLAEQDALLSSQADRHHEIAWLAIAIDDFCACVKEGLTNANFEQKRQLVELLVDRVIVTDAEVEIRYVIPTHPRSEHVRFCHLRTDYFARPPFIGPGGVKLAVEDVGGDTRGFPGGVGVALLRLHRHQARLAHQVARLVAAHVQPFLPQLQRQAAAAVGLAGLSVDRLGLRLQMGAPRRRPAVGLPVVVAALVHAQHTAQLRHGVRLHQPADEVAAHRISWAKKALAFFKMSFSVSNCLMRRFNCWISRCSGVSACALGDGFPASSAKYCYFQRFTAASPPAPAASQACLAV